MSTPPPPVETLENVDECAICRAPIEDGSGVVAIATFHGASEEEGIDLDVDSMLHESCVASVLGLGAEQLAALKTT